MTGIYLFLALLLTVSGATLLRVSWAKPKRHKPSLLAAWGLVVLSAVPWSFYGGIDRGITFSILALSAAGLALLLYKMRGQERTKTHKGKERTTVTNEATSALRIFGRRFYVFLLAGPIALAGATMLSMSLYGILNQSWLQQNSLALVFFAFPLLWASMLIYSLLDSSLIKRSNVILASTGIGYAGIQYFSAGVIQ